MDAYSHKNFNSKTNQFVPKFDYDVLFIFFISLQHLLTFICVSPPRRSCCAKLRMITSSHPWTQLYRTFVQIEQLIKECGENQESSPATQKLCLDTVWITSIIPLFVFDANARIWFRRLKAPQVIIGLAFDLIRHGVMQMTIDNKHGLFALAACGKHAKCSCPPG